MITPKEIEEKDFKRSLRGYDEDEVDEYLDLIILDLQALQDELAKVKAENEALKKENMDHKDSQVSVMHTLDQAKKLMQDISESAEKRADIIIRNAKLDAEMILKDAKDSVYKYSGEGGDLREQVTSFRERYRKMLQDELEQFESKSDSFLEEFDQEFMPKSIVDELPDTEDIAIDKAEAELEKIKVRENMSPEELFAQLEKEIKTGTSLSGGILGDGDGATKETTAISSEEIRKLLEKTDKR